MTGERNGAVRGEGWGVSAVWTPEQMHVLDVRPGITDPASIKFRNENELMEQAEDPEKYYIEVIMQ